MLRNVCKVKSTKIYNSGNINHLSQEDLTEIDNSLKKRKVKLISFSVILYLQQNKIILIALIITLSTALGFEPRYFDCWSTARPGLESQRNRKRPYSTERLQIL